MSGTAPRNWTQVIEKEIAEIKAKVDAEVYS
jgi:hypothetical protein